MTKDEKLRAIIKRDVSTGFMRNLEAQFRSHNDVAIKLNAHPEFIPHIIDELVEKQLPFYQTVSDEAADAAYRFFMSPSGQEWCDLSAKFVLHLNDLVEGWAEDIYRRIVNLN